MHPRLFAAITIGAFLVPLSASARVRDNSVRTRPSNLGLADVDGDGSPDWVGIDTSSQDSVKVHLGSNRDFYIQYMIGGWIGIGGMTIHPQYTFTGHFRNKLRDDVCVMSVLYTGSSSPDVDCFEYDSWTQQMYSFGASTGVGGVAGDMVYRLPIYLSATTRGYAVGDFDGDGYDEVLTYNRTDGSNSQLWRYDFASAKFVSSTSVALGHLANLSSAGGIDLLTGEISDADTNGGARRDDVVAYNRTTREVTTYRSLIVNGQKTLQQWYQVTSQLGANDDVIVASVDGDSRDDLIAVDRTTGHTRFFSLYRVLSFPPLQALTVQQGNLPYPYYQGIHQMWASQSFSRDTVFAVLDDGTVHHYGPVIDGNGQKTYWWIGGYSVGYVWSRIAP